MIYLVLFVNALGWQVQSSNNVEVACEQLKQVQGQAYLYAFDGKTMIESYCVWPEKTVRIVPKKTFKQELDEAASETGDIFETQDRGFFNITGHFCKNKKTGQQTLRAKSETCLPSEIDER